MQGRWLIAMLGLSLVLTATADAGTKRRWELRTVRVDTQYRMPPGTMDGPCSGAQPPGCVSLHGTETMSGTFAATGTYTAHVYPHATSPGDLGYDGPNLMTGTIEGCGRGTFVYVDDSGILYSSQFDPLTRSIRGHNHWTIDPASTTGQLARRFVSGSGVQDWLSYPFNQDPEQENWGVGTITGTVVCRLPV